MLKESLWAPTCLCWMWGWEWSRLPGPGWCRWGWVWGYRGAGGGDCCHSSGESSPQAETGREAESVTTSKHWFLSLRGSRGDWPAVAGPVPSSSGECLKAGLVCPAAPPPRSRGGTWSRSAVSPDWRLSACCPAGGAGAPRGGRESPPAPPLGRPGLQAGQAGGKIWAGRRSSRWADWPGSVRTELGTEPSARF